MSCFTLTLDNITWRSRPVNGGQAVVKVHSIQFRRSIWTDFLFFCHLGTHIHTDILPLYTIHFVLYFCTLDKCSSNIHSALGSGLVSLTPEGNIQFCFCEMLHLVHQLFASVCLPFGAEQVHQRLNLACCDWKQVDGAGEREHKPVKLWVVKAIQWAGRC